MSNEVKQILEVTKTPILPIPFTKKAKRNMLRIQGEYQIKHGKKISLKNLASKIMETATI